MAANPEFIEALTDALKRRGRTTVIVRGRSMYPLIRNGGRVVVEPVAYDELQTGDIVVFDNGEELVCHRLLRKANRECWFKGDTVLRSDTPVAWPRVLGRVTHLVDAQCRILPLDTPELRRKAVRLARYSHFYALYLNLLHALGRVRWWSRQTGN